MDKMDLWRAWQSYAERVNKMFITGEDPIKIRDMLACSCLSGDEPVEGLKTDDKQTMWHWLMELPGFHSDFVDLERVKDNIGEGMGPFSEALMNLQRWNAESYHDDAVMWTQKAYDMYVEHWAW